jgi:Tetratricopeptide repeat
LARVLESQGDLAGAKALVERAVAVDESVLGIDHPWTIRSRQQLEQVSSELGRLTNSSDSAADP